jgi:uncharacterized membrane protein
MSLFLIAYLIALVAFALVDIAWLTTVGGQLYKSTLGDILAPEIRMAPAVVFYLLYPMGLVYFAIIPALNSGSMSTALVNGALFGLFTYATYELTNFATLRNWTLSITVIDIAYGVVLGAVVSAVAYALTPTVLRWTGA